MSSIASLQQQLTQLGQQKAVHEQQVSKHHQHSVSNLIQEDEIGAAGDERIALKEKGKVEQIDNQINKLQQELSQLQAQATNIEAAITQRKNQYSADQAKLEQQFKIELRQLESDHARVLG